MDAKCPDCGVVHEIDRAKVEAAVQAISKTLVDHQIPLIEGLAALQVVALTKAKEHGVFITAGIMDASMPAPWRRGTADQTVH